MGGALYLNDRERASGYKIIAMSFKWLLTATLVWYGNPRKNKLPLGRINFRAGIPAVNNFQGKVSS